jgi:hypothetical protein
MNVLDRRDGRTFMEMTDSRPTVVICDAGALIHLDEVSCLDRLAGDDYEP